MYNLSELIKTDCCIDCGTNEKLREVVGKICIRPHKSQVRFGINKRDSIISIENSVYTTLNAWVFYMESPAIPLTSINIDL